MRSKMMFLGECSENASWRFSIILLALYLLDPTCANLLEENGEWNQLGVNQTYNMFPQGYIAPYQSQTLGTVFPHQYAAPSYTASPYVVRPYTPVTFQIPLFRAGFTPDIVAPLGAYAPNEGSLPNGFTTPNYPMANPTYSNPAYSLLSQQSYPTAYPRMYPPPYQQPAPVYRPLLLRQLGFLPQAHPRPGFQHPAYFHSRYLGTQYPRLLPGYGQFTHVGNPYQQSMFPQIQSQTYPSQSYPLQQTYASQSYRAQTVSTPTIQTAQVHPLQPPPFHYKPTFELTKTSHKTLKPPIVPKPKSSSSSSLKTPSSPVVHHPEETKMKPKKAELKPTKQRTPLIKPRQSRQPPIPADVNLEDDKYMKKLIKEMGWWEGWGDVLNTNALNEPTQPFSNVPNTKTNRDSSITLKVVPKLQSFPYPELKTSNYDIVPTNDGEAGEGQDVLTIKLLLPKAM